jgi:hypothetical protein
LRCGSTWGDSTLVNPFGVGLVVFVIFIRRLKPTAIHGVALRATATNTIPVKLALMGLAPWAKICRPFVALEGTASRKA